MNWDSVESPDRFPFHLPLIRNLGTREFHPAVTYFVGENGSVRSTLLEALASCGLEQTPAEITSSATGRAAHLSDGREQVLHERSRVVRGLRCLGGVAVRAESRSRTRGNPLRGQSIHLPGERVGAPGRRPAQRLQFSAAGSATVEDPTHDKQIQEHRDMGNEGKRDEAKGRIKKAAGELTDDDDLKREGMIDKAKGKAKQAVDDVSNKLKD